MLQKFGGEEIRIELYNPSENAKIEFWFSNWVPTKENQDLKHPYCETTHEFDELFIESYIFENNIFKIYLY